MTMGKRILIYLICLLNVLNVLNVYASDLNSKIQPPAQYILNDFENSELTNVANSTLTYGGSKGAFHFSSTKDWDTKKFKFYEVEGNSYDISLMLKLSSNLKANMLETCYFIIYSEAVDGKGKLWTQLKAQPSAKMQSGEWIKVTAQYISDGYAYKTVNGKNERLKSKFLSNSTIELRIGNGLIADTVADGGELSYIIDDFYVIPNEENKKNPNLVECGSFDTAEQISNYWTTHLGVGATLEYISDETSNGAVKVTINKDWATISTKEQVKIEYLKKYRISYKARAVSENAVGKEIMSYLDYEQSGYTGLYKFLRPSGNVKTLSEEWQEYSTEFTVDTNKLPSDEAVYTKLYFRGGSGQDKISFALDDIVLEEMESKPLKGDCGIYGNPLNGNNVFVSTCFRDCIPGGFFYRIMQYVGGEYVGCGSGTVYDSSKSIPTPVSENAEKVLIDVMLFDAHGNCGVVKTKVFERYSDEKVEYKNISVDEYVFNDDKSSLTAEFTLNNVEEDKIMLIFAMYSDGDILLKCDFVEKDISGIQNNYFELTVDTVKECSYVKFFMWRNGEMLPVTESYKVNKIQDDEFIYVDSKNVSGVEDGSYQKPFNSLQKAVEYLKGVIKTSNSSKFYIVLEAGEYYIDSPVNFDDFLYESDKEVIITSASKERAILSGGKHISDFSVWDREKNIYRTKLSDGIDSREMYVNGIRATRARSAEEIIAFENLDSTAGTFENKGLIAYSLELSKYKYPTELEFVFIDYWRQCYIRPNSITADGDKSKIIFDEAKWKKLVKTSSINATTPIYIENAYELLDKPGEWYIDTHEDYLYYIPREFEDINTIDVVIPITERLISASSTPDSPVGNISFRNIAFSYVAWNAPTRAGLYSTGQSVYGSTDSTSLMSSVAEFENVKNIDFVNCTFSNVGGTSIKMIGAVQDCNITGNEFSEMGGGAIILGDINGDAINPSSENLYVKNNTISNNYIHGYGRSYGGAAAVSIGFPKNLTVSNNEITDGSYSGIHIGWGWDSNEYSQTATENVIIEKNYIHNVLNSRLSDGGAIYTLGRTNATAENPNIIRRNYFADSKNNQGTIYNDQSSNYWSITENVVDASNYPIRYSSYRNENTTLSDWFFVCSSTVSDITVKGNYSTTPRYSDRGGKNINYEEPILYSNHNIPEQAQKIIDEAGIGKDYIDNFNREFQTLDIPLYIEISKGDTYTLSYNSTGSKDKAYDSDEIRFLTDSSNNSVATSNALNITGVSAGRAWIDITYYEQNKDGTIKHYGKQKILVTVK